MKGRDCCWCGVWGASHRARSSRRGPGVQEGTIAEQGRHSELVQKGGLYAEMWQRQAEAAAIEEFGTPAIAEDAPPSMPDSRVASELSLSNGFGQAHGN